MVSQPSSAMAVIYFDTAQSDLTDAHKNELYRVIDTGWPVSRVLLTGFADRSGNQAYNLQLSQKRAQTVADWLAELGINPAAITISARGETDGQVETPDGTAEPLNRRVEVVIEYE